MKLTIENALPVEYNRVLSLRGLELGADIIGDSLKLPVHAISKYLGLKKNRDDANGTSLVVRDEKGNFIVAGLVKYHQPEQEDQAGNWSYEFTFDENKIKEARQYNITDSAFMEVLQNVAANHSLFIEDMQFAFDVVLSFFISLKNVLEQNVTPTEECEIDCDGFFVAVASVEDDEVVYSIIPSGEMKRLIKDDSSLEDTIQSGK